MADSAETDFLRRVEAERERLAPYRGVPPPPTPEQAAEASRVGKKQKIVELLRVSGLVAKLAAEKGIPTNVDFYTSKPPPPVKFREWLRGDKHPNIEKVRFSGWALPVHYREPPTSTQSYDIPGPTYDYRRGVALVADGGDYSLGKYGNRLVPVGGLHVFAMGVERAGVVRAQLNNLYQNISPDCYDRGPERAQTFDRQISELSFGASSGVDAISGALVNFAAQADRGAAK